MQTRLSKQREQLGAWVIERICFSPYSVQDELLVSWGHGALIKQAAAAGGVGDVLDSQTGKQHSHFCHHHSSL